MKTICEMIDEDMMMIAVSRSLSQVSSPPLSPGFYALEAKHTHRSGKPFL